MWDEGWDRFSGSWRDQGLLGWAAPGAGQDPLSQAAAQENTRLIGGAPAIRSGGYGAKRGELAC